MDKIRGKMMAKMMVIFVPFGTEYINYFAEYVDYMAEIVDSCIFPMKICTGLTFFHRKNMQMMHKNRGSICRKKSQIRLHIGLTRKLCKLR